MKIKIFIKQANKIRYKKMMIELQKENTISEIKEKIGITETCISFNRYYKMNSRELVSLENKIPFIIKDNRIVEWDLDINDVQLQEFVQSNNINLDKGIYIEFGYVQAGGSGYVREIFELWEKIYPCLEIVATVAGSIEFIRLIKACFKRNVPNPHAFSEYIYRHDKWSHVILAEQLQIDKENAKQILKLFGYKWNNSQKLYVISKKSKYDMIKKINNRDMFGKG